MNAKHFSSQRRITVAATLIAILYMLAHGIWIKPAPIGRLLMETAHVAACVLFFGLIIEQIPKASDWLAERIFPR